MSLLPLLGRGCGGCGTKTESAVDVPVTLAAVRALHHPPEVTVEVARKEKQVGGGGCGHSALCVVLIPLIAYDRVFPSTWDEAKVNERGSVVYEGRFRTDGELIEAKARKDGVARLITVLPLDELGRRVIVEAARAPIGADGSEGPFVKTKIVPQIDLPAAYTKALASEKDEKDRADLLVEAVTWLGDESLPLLRETLPAEGDVAAARTIEKLCARPEDPLGKAVRAEIMAQVSAKPGPKTAEQGMRCAVVSHDVKAALPFARALGAALCEAPADRAAKAIADAFDDVPRSVASFASQAELDQARKEAASERARCDRVERKVLLELVGRLPVSRGDLEQALSSDGLGDRISWEISAQDAEQREALFAALPRRTYDSGLLAALARGEWSPEARDLERLAAIHLRENSRLDGGERDGSLLRIYARAKGNPAKVSGARKALEGAVIAAPASERPRLRAGLLVLGDTTQALPASRALAGMQRLPGLRSQEPIVTALELAGCSKEQILELAAKAASVKDEDRGAACARERALPSIGE